MSTAFYSSPRSTSTQKVRLCQHHKGVVFDEERLIDQGSLAAHRPRDDQRRRVPHGADVGRGGAAPPVAAWFERVQALPNFAPTYAFLRAR